MRIPSVKELRAFLEEGARQLLDGTLYSAGVYARRLATWVAAPFCLSAKKLQEGQKGLWGRLDAAITPGDRYVWVLAEAPGALGLCRTLIGKLRHLHPEYKVLLTLSSPVECGETGDYTGADCVCCVPFDTAKRVRRFLYKVNPEMALFVNGGFRRNCLRELWRRQVPVYLVDAVFRPGQRFFKRRGAWRGHWLKWFTRIFVRDTQGRDLLAGLGVENVEVAGDMRYDLITEALGSREGCPLLDAFVGKKGDGNRASFVFMSVDSTPADEEVYGPWLRGRGGVKGVVAPRETDGERIAGLKGLAPGEVVLMSELVKDPEAGAGKRVLVIDSRGSLPGACAYADVAYVGGAGGEDSLSVAEAAAYGIPVVFGPGNSKSLEAQELKTLGGGIEVADAVSFERNADRLLYDPGESGKRGRWAGEYVREKSGAADRVLASIFAE